MARGSVAGGAVGRQLALPGFEALVAPDARALGTQEGTNAHLLARRMKHRGRSWTLPGTPGDGQGP